MAPDKFVFQALKCLSKLYKIFYYFFLQENTAWRFVWIICLADDSCDISFDNCLAESPNKNVKPCIIRSK